MHKVSEEEINAIARPTALFNQHDKLDCMEISDAKTTPSKNQRDNGASTPIGTQPYLLNSPLTGAVGAPDEPPLCPCVEAGDATHLARVAELPDVRLKGADGMIFGVYQDWVYQNTGNHLDGGITENSQWKAMWEKLSIFQPNATMQRMVKLVEILSQTSQWSSMAYELRSGTFERVIFFSCSSCNTYNP